MGRPIRSDRNGVQVFGTYVGAAEGIRCEAYIGGTNQSDVFIIKQLGARRYKVQEVSGSVTARAKLVSGVPAADGEMRLQGFIGGDPAQPITLRKLNKRTATSYAGARYKWLLNDDSTAGEEGRINLTLIS
jgi:hypothetical protein